LTDNPVLLRCSNPVKDASLKHGEWLLWVEKNLPFSRQTADNYRRAFENRAKLLTVGNLTEGYRLLSGGGQLRGQFRAGTFQASRLLALKQGWLRFVHCHKKRPSIPIKGHFISTEPPGLWAGQSARA
jgi:hypothetical protein